MKNTKKFNYDEVFMGVFQNRPEGFYVETYNDKPELRRIVEMVKVQKGRMLDIGSGGGLLTECLPFYFPDVQIFGCDVSSTAIKYAKKFGTGKVSYKTNSKKLHYPSAYFDVCLCSDVLEHIPDVPYFLHEVRRILKKNGLFFLSIPCEGQPFTIHWLLGKMGIWKDLTFKHVGHIHPEFTHENIIQLFQKHGFTVLSRKFNERLLIQFLRYVTFMIPKEILEMVIGKQKAEKYYDRNVVTKKEQHTNDFFMIIRTVWLKICKVTKVVYDIDAEYFTDIGFTAGKIFLLVRKN